MIKDLRSYDPKRKRCFCEDITQIENYEKMRDDIGNTNKWECHHRLDNNHPVPVNRKKIQCIETGDVFYSSHDPLILRLLNKDKIITSKLRECANGKRKTAYGYTWRFI